MVEAEEPIAATDSAVKPASELDRACGGDAGGEPDGVPGVDGIPDKENNEAPREDMAQTNFELFPESTTMYWVYRMHRAAQVHAEQLERTRRRKKELLERKQQEQGGHQGPRTQAGPDALVSPGSESFRHTHPGQPIFFGGRLGGHRAPVAFLETLSPALTNYLRYDPWGPFKGGLVEWTCSPHWNWNDWGFAEDKEQVLKADWHAIPSGTDDAEVFVPRLAKVKVMRRAPPRIEAFAEAFRAVNREVWSCIVDQLLMNSGEQKLPTAVAMAIASDHSHFGSIEAQIRWGTEPLNLPSHVDGATSLLHLGLTLAGERVVRCGVFSTPDVDPLSEVNVWDDALWREEHLKEERMTLGKAYISSPFCFEHAVRYLRTEQHEPVIALQFRLAFRGEIGPELNNARKDGSVHWISRVIAGVLAVAGDGGWLRMPSLEEVKSAEARLAAARKFREKREAGVS